MDQATTIPGWTSKYILLTDIARSSHLAEAYPQQYYAALETHNSIVEGAVKHCGGEILKNLGDGYLALFDDAASALDAAVELQLALCTGREGSIAVFPDGSKLGVRAVVHGGEITRIAGQEQDWFGPPINRCARIGGVCHPGQLLISGVVRHALPALPPGLEELDLGRMRLRDLGEPEQLYQLTHPGFAQRQFPPLLGLDSRPNNLLSQPNLFIGRDREMAELSRLLSGEARLVTLHAPGGYGKSRLASQLLAHALWRFENGAFEVLLAPIRGHQYLPEAIATATGFQFSGKREPQEQVLDYLRNKEMLLCLDNFEHMLEGADFIAEILKTAPKVRIVVTSREPLRLTAERVYRVAPLPLGPGSDSVQLFADRATRVLHGFQLNEETAHWVGRICERLEGIPLAIELSAAWVDGFTLPEMYAELEQQLELTARQTDVPERQRSVRASCDWSYGLLKPDLQQALRRLSVFQGGFFLEAAQAVLGLRGMALRTALAALSDKSWLFTREVELTNEGETTAVTRYFLRDAASHEYALEKLLETNAGRADGPVRHSDADTAVQATSRVEPCVRPNTDPLTMGRTQGSTLQELTDYQQATGTHARYFSALMEREGPRLQGDGTPTGQLDSLNTIKLELLNIYEALDTLQNRMHEESAVTLLQPIAEHLWRYLDMTSAFFAQHERYSLLLETAQGRGSTELELQAQLGLSRAHFRLGNFSDARALYEQSLVLSIELGDRYGEAVSLNDLGNVEFMQGNFSAAQALYEQSLALRRELGDRHGEADSLHGLGNVEYMQGNYSAAQALYEQSLALYRVLGNRHGETNSLNNLGTVEQSLGNYSAAQALYEQSLALKRELGDRSGEAHSLHGLGTAEQALGNYRVARGLYEQSLALKRELGDRHGEAHSLGGLGVVEYMQGNYSDARGLYEQSLALRRELGNRSGEATSLSNLGAVEYMLGNYSIARGLYEQSLVLSRELSRKSSIMVSCACAGAVLAALGRLQESALALFGGKHCAASLDHHFDPDDRQMLDSGLARLDAAIAAGEISADEVEALKVQAETLSIEELADTVLAALADAKVENGGESEAEEG